MSRMIREIEHEVGYTRHMIGKDALDPRVMEAMAAVPREAFVPESEKKWAYENGPLPIGHGQTISQPFIVALMTDLLQPDVDDVVLEVGSGCGYQAAILARLAAQVYGIERVPELASQAADRLRQLGYANVEIRCGDGYYGWPEHAPFDAIVVSAAAPHVPQPLVDQLKTGGRLVVPLGGGLFGQELVVVERTAEGGFTRREVLGVAFVPLVGERHDQPAHQG